MVDDGVAWAVGVVTSVGANAVYAVLAFLVGFVYLKIGWRRLFSVHKPRAVTVVVAGSQFQTAKHIRQNTGIGQVRAIAEIAPRFAQAYWRSRLDQVFVPTDSLNERISGDLICLGGGNSNSLTKELLETLAIEPGFPVKPIADSQIVWSGVSHKSVGDGTTLTKDFGLIVRAQNPMSTVRGAVILLLSGASTHGTHAAAKVFSTDRWFRRSGSFAAVVECGVRDGLPYNVHVVARAWRRPRDKSWTTEMVGQ
jgi:hypothetical protein